jgi:hypothetical protein
MCTRFVKGRSALTEKQSDTIGLKTSQDIRYDGDCSEVVLLTSHAGSTRYDRTFMESFVRPGPGYSNWVSRTNGFASLNAPYSGGEAITQPFIHTGHELEINYRTGAAGSLRMEIQNADGKPISGYALSDCPEILDDKIIRIVTWQNGSKITDSSDPIRLR